ncbi:MAG: hypothetical protein VB023_06600 [Oscillibacter sp.]|nr:hypothetical protein [Oscillibacter sp.]
MYDLFAILQNGVLAVKQGAESREKADFDVLFSKMRRRTFMLTFELGVALPYHAAVLASGVPYLGAIETAAVAANDASVNADLNLQVFAG